MTFVNTNKTGSANFTELHVHAFGAENRIEAGDRVCFYTDKHCPTAKELCGPRCGVAVWAGPDTKLIHTCAPSTYLSVPQQKVVRSDDER